MLERPALAEFVALTLNHSVDTTRAVAMASEAETTVAEWQPHLLASAVYYVKGPGDPEPAAMKRAREALRAL